MQNLPTHPAVLAANIRPWGDRFPDAIGTTYNAQTDRGNNVVVWRPDDGVPRDCRYWCHGHSTLSYWLHQYSIFSGPEMEIVLADEWLQIDKKPNVGDIVIFRARNTHFQGRTRVARVTILHSARIEFANQSWGSRTAIRLSSKNGMQQLELNLTPEQILRDYNQTRWYTTEPSCCCCCCDSRTNKQYYRRINGAVGGGPFLGLGYDYLH